MVFSLAFDLMNIILLDLVRKVQSQAIREII